ncbi:MAG: histidine phosphatase family protein [Firmicutes bacterium]|nr:histidine phosphatase family protein [Bacillota bacterium]
MLTLLVARHGQSEGDTFRRVEGSADLALTATGRLQGRLLVERLVREHRPAAVFTSPLRRARDIAADLAGRLGVPLLEDPRLAEQSTGLLAGRSYEEVESRWPFPRRGLLVTDAPAGGESMLEHYCRVADFLLNLVDVLGERFPGVWGRRERRFEDVPHRDSAPWAAELVRACGREPGAESLPGREPAHPVGPVTEPGEPSHTLAVIAHGGTTGWLLSVLLGLAPNAEVGFVISETGLSEVVLKRGFVWVRRLNCQDHLPPLLRRPGSRDVAAEDPPGVAEAVGRWMESRFALRKGG